MAKENAILSKIYAGYDAGHFNLPSELVVRREAEVKVNARLRALNDEMRQVQPAAVRDRLAREAIEGAATGDIPAGLGAEFIAEHEKLRRLSADHDVLTEARAELVERTPWLAMRLSEDILANSLRPAFEEVLDGLRARANVLGRVPWGETRALVRASKEVREAHEFVAEATVRYQAIRDAQWRLKELTGSPSEEAWWRFGHLRNMTDVWPSRGAWSDRFRGSPPWPEDPLAYLHWLVASEAEPWLPTAAECERRNVELLSGVTVVRGVAVPVR